MLTQTAYRSGTAVVDGHRIPFRLYGSSGRYDRADNQVFFDREGNGKYEVYRSNDQWVNLAGHTFAFGVDPVGASLTLKPSDFRQDRPQLQTGTAIPNVSVTDLAGASHALLHNTADFTLLEFWDTHCGPCEEEMPKLKALYDRQPRSRFDIVGVSSDVSEKELRAYLTRLSIAWAECREDWEGPTFRLFRIDGIPSYFLLGRDGTIVDQWFGSGSTISKIEARLK